MSEKNQHDQDAIWDVYQNDKIFAESGCPGGGRHEFIANKIKTGITVLNIGVGRGTLERILNEQGVHISCLDPSEKTIKKVSTYIKNQKEARVGHAEKIPWPKNTFDVVIMSEVLEHLQKNAINLALEEVARVLKETGCFFGTVPADEKLEDSLVICPKCNDSFHRWGHQRSFTSNSLERMLNQTFVSVRVSRRVFAEFNSLNIWGKISHFYKSILSGLGVKTSGQHFVFEARGPKIINSDPSTDSSKNIGRSSESL
jgi:ubiquinone/menaquinone biosynthesis C-methylase UbiE